MSEKYVIFKVYSGEDPLFWGHRNMWVSRRKFPHYIKEMGYLKVQFLTFVLSLAKVETSIFNSKDIQIQKFKDKLALRRRSEGEK